MSKPTDDPQPSSRVRRWFAAARTALVFAVVWASPAIAAAQGELSEAAKETTIPGGQLVIVSYVVLWLGLLGYVGYLGMRQQKLGDELDELERRIDETLGNVRDEE